MTCYDMIKIVIKDEETYARPIEWNEADYDGTGNTKDGYELLATKYMTTNPKNGQLIHIFSIDLEKLDNEKYKVYRAVDPTDTSNELIFEERPFIKTLAETLDDEEDSLPIKEDIEIDDKDINTIEENIEDETIETVEDKICFVDPLDNNQIKLKINKNLQKMLEEV